MIKGGEQLNRLSKKGAIGPRNPLQQAATMIERTLGDKLPQIALVLGSGFQAVLDTFHIETQMNVAEIPGFPTPRVKGHPGQLLVANIERSRMLVLVGRSHFYEGLSMEELTLPVRLLAECGVQQLVLTNAAGGINSAYAPGDFMLFRDHINFIGVNPLRGLPVEDGRIFVDLTDTYCPALRNAFCTAAAREKITLHEGVYLGVSGPSYETPAEIRAFRTMGADAVGMSTIPEVLMARYCGMKVAALSCITNFAAGLSSSKLSHHEVLGAGQQNAANAARLLRSFAGILENDAKN